MNCYDCDTGYVANINYLSCDACSTLHASCTVCS
jgi:hypothetical protein